MFLGTNILLHKPKIFHLCWYFHTYALPPPRSQAYQKAKQSQRIAEFGLGLQKAFIGCKPPKDRCMKHFLPPKNGEKQSDGKARQHLQNWFLTPDRLMWYKLPWEYTFQSPQRRRNSKHSACAHTHTHTQLEYASVATKTRGINIFEHVVSLTMQPYIITRSVFYEIINSNCLHSHYIVYAPYD